MACAEGVTNLNQEELVRKANQHDQNLPISD